MPGNMLTETEEPKKETEDSFGKFKSTRPADSKGFLTAGLFTD